MQHGKESARSPTLVQLTFAGGLEDYPAWSPDGKQILYVAQAGQARKVFRKDLQSGQTTQLTQGAVDDVQPAWSPDGTKILYVRSQGQKIQPSDIFGVFLDADVWHPRSIPGFAGADTPLNRYRRPPPHDEPNEEKRTGG